MSNLSSSRVARFCFAGLTSFPALNNWLIDRDLGGTTDLGGVFDRLIGTDVQCLPGGKGGFLSLVPTSQGGIDWIKKK